MKTKLLILLIGIAFVGCGLLHAQKDSLTKKEFEGVITYNVKYELSPNIEADSGHHGTEWKFYYKKGKYRLIMNGTGAKMIIYLSEFNTQYFFNEKGVLYNSILCDKDKRKVKESSLVPSNEKILGRNCMKLTQKYNDGEIHVFESDTSIYVNPDYYASHQYTLLNQSMHLLPSQFLKYVYTDLSGSILTLTATKIEEIVVADSIFIFNKDNLKTNKTKKEIKLQKKRNKKKAKEEEEEKAINDIMDGLIED